MDLVARVSLATVTLTAETMICPTPATDMFTLRIPTSVSKAWEVGRYKCIICLLCDHRDFISFLEMQIGAG